MKQIAIAICHYPHALKSAIYGLQELFLMANRICDQSGLEVEFLPVIVDGTTQQSSRFNVVLLPPSAQSDFYLNPETTLIDWLKAQHNQGAVLASACAGSFVLAATQILAGRTVTTHWGLSDLFQLKYPDIPLDINQILIDHGDVITAGGMMSWLDLGFELVTKYTSVKVMRQLGKQLVVDTALREQRYYQQFTPSLLHGDQVVVAIQQMMNLEYGQPLSIQAIAAQFHLTERTMQRRFLKATGYNPNHYLQRLRIQKACDLLESSQLSFEVIARQVGYEDTSACRKVFIKTMGLTPKAFRHRFM
ncbi:GlxA family transcriptional regulator [Vibrio navarrensis]|uniref:AraC family transcriptional regulator n=1 Tax=Vibrio navarrensis TaxID=29495 RepID=A0A099LTF9_9VIBR|nr:helix-turn-helix domain-containing protein [Vibrio navarrensis]KGK11538.1 AraC family transcriptional regulator [Vibrio navarrensis]KGK20920.1 AraC family transcriptional regulator [Vibrio navarrensis]MBE4583074.1 AraC family transcriptional regulator [Vibrio navarrensis]MBE4616596.1 AraC family transcriptional regulator [Vibrio navarrensis]QOD67940.1 helix-turn-helix domain-containing protein [Vibrio navarrensis]